MATTGRPRDPDVEGRVLRATLELLDAKGYAGLRIDDVAAAAGVAKTTVYRRWRSLPEVALDAIELALGERRFAPTGDVEADLVALLHLMHGSLEGNPVGWHLPLIGVDLLSQAELAERYRERFVAPLRGQAITLIERGVAEGRFSPEVDAATLVDAVVGSLLYRRVVGGDPPEPATLVRLALRALRP